MIQEEKPLLLKDLCGRLPYGVIIHNKEEGYEGRLNSINQTIFGVELGVNITATCRVDFQLDTCKPYLRLLSSMTEEEEEEFKRVLEIELDHLANNEVGHTVKSAASSAFEIDFYNKNHFDYRGLIEKGLALEAPPEIYKTE